MLLSITAFQWGFSKFFSPDPSRSIALMPRYNAHFVPVKHYGCRHPVTGKTLPLDVDFQVRCFDAMVLPFR